MNALPSFFPSDGHPVRAVRPRRFPAIAAIGLICAAAHAQTQCPGYVETDAGSAFDIASIIRDTGSPQSALDKIRNAVARVNAGGGCSIFRDRLACEETLTLANKAIAALQVCAMPGAKHG
ncbi:hypothetical protein BSFA1_65700 (plasmid) [Burkholderia sp. SFA1]|uniref:hypothetical protein n=1 Tax=unclassified Caballeronia TaxID=2646786 RepID=UPI00023876CE|nr:MULTISPECIES: hypothetical protein [unclassified Caballeronia]AET94644.1 hypothetical protein BYI23_D011340 [Burkholderia sp. YI23]MCE4546162.1 hypothetical protein [Caballeronia sp. PC1]MCE4573363.1 hypothetical protein [Caballeronia sp. CLC5]BBQ01442.1 hypothetical protein BSFA1_65700 [Burkholderia sp. SFA1]